MHLVLLMSIQEDMSRRRMEHAGVVLTTTNTAIAELVQDWSSPAGTELVKLLGLYRADDAAGRAVIALMKIPLRSSSGSTDIDDFRSDTASVHGDEAPLLDRRRPRRFSRASLARLSWNWLLVAQGYAFAGGIRLRRARSRYAWLR